MGALTLCDISHRIDDSSGSIGKRYARTDEVAIPFGMTVDFDSLKEPHTVTLRERDTTTQIRIGVDKVAEVVRQLSTGRTTWVEVCQQFPKFEAQEAKASDEKSVCKEKTLVLTESELRAWDEHFRNNSYVKGFTPSVADKDLINLLADKNISEDTPNLARWSKHIR